MHTEQQIQDLGLLNKGLQLLNIDVAYKPDKKLTYPVPCRLINNADGSLKWIWPAASREPQILRFHSCQDSASKWFARTIRAAYKLGMPGLICSGKTVLYTTAIGFRQLQRLNDWAIYTGKAGINRKLVIWHEDHTGCSAFSKLSLSIYAAKNIYTERMAVQQPTPESVVVPQTIVTRCMAFTQQDMSAFTAQPPLQELADLPQTAVRQWLGQGLQMQSLSEVSWYREAQSWLQAAKPGPDERIPEVLLQKMRTLLDCMLPQAMVPVSRAHGDFTPRNLRRDGDKLVLIDWQRSRDDMPALYDLFHFIYQSNILIKGKPFAAIRQQIDELLRQPEWEHFLLEHDIDAGEAEQQYLLCTISSYLQEYAQQAKGHSGAFELMQTWCEALGFWMDYEGLLTQRQIVLQDVVHFLHDKQYAAIQLCTEDITALPLSADLDLCLPQAATSALIAYMRKHRCVERIREKRRAARHELSIFLSGGSAVHLLCASELRSGSLIFANAKQIWKAAKLNAAGVRQPAFRDELQYTRLHHLLNGNAVPQQYRDTYLAQDTASTALMQYDEANRDQCVSFLKKQPENRGIQGLKHRLRHGIDTLYSILPKQGFIITFSGLHGAGTRTVIEATRRRIGQELRMPVMVLPHRPSLLPLRSIEQSEGGTISVRVKPKRSGLIYYLDYLLGLSYVHLRYVMRGYVVLYDHYFDVVNDSNDGNVMLPAAFTTWWYRFLLKPDLNFLLYAPADVIRERRQELSAESIEQLTGKYLALFEKLERRSGQGHYISVRNLRLGETVETLFHHIKTRQEEVAA